MAALHLLQPSTLSADCTETLLRSLLYPDGVTPPRVTRSGDSANHPMTLGAIEGFQTNQIESEEGRKARAAYFAAVDFLDEILGDFLAVMERDGLLDNTVIIYTSDHGELAGEHGLWWKNTWHEGASRVPLIVSLPARGPRSRRSDGPGQPGRPVPNAVWTFRNRATERPRWHRPSPMPSTGAPVWHSTHVLESLPSLSHPVGVQAPNSEC